MARLVGPDEGSRFAYGIRADNTLTTSGGLPVTVYADAGATTLADILTHPGGAVVPGSVLEVGASSLLPLFQFPDGVDVVYVRVGVGGGVFPVYARTDDRLDAIDGRAVTSYRVTVSGATGDGTTDDRAALASITRADIFFPAGTYRVASNLTLAGAVRFERGAILKPDSGVTITFTQGTPEAGWYQIFDTTAGGNISIGNTQIGEVRAAWFGAKADGTTDDTAAILAACNSMSARGTLLLSKGQHNVSGKVIDRTSTQAITLKGWGRQATVLYITANLSEPLIHIRGSSITSHSSWSTIQGLTIRQNVYGTYTGDAILLEQCDRLTIIDVAFVRITGHAIKGREWWDSNLIGVQIMECGTTTKAAIHLEAFNPADAQQSCCNHLHFTDVQIEGSYGTHLYAGPYTAKCQFKSTKFHGQVPPPPYPSVVVDGGIGLTFDACTWTAGGTHHVLITGAGGVTPAGNRFVGVDICSAGAATSQSGYGIYQEAGDRTIVEASGFGVNGTNDLGSIGVAGGTLVLGDAVESFDLTGFVEAGGTILRRSLRRNDSLGWFIGAEGMASQTGAPSQSNSPGGFKYRSWLLDAVSAEGVICSFRVPDWVTSVNVELHWSNAGAGSGAVRWSVTVISPGAGGAMNVAGTVATKTVTALAQDVMTVSQFGPFAVSGMASVVIARVAADVADTLPNDAAALGLAITVGS